MTHSVPLLDQNARDATDSASVLRTDSVTVIYTVSQKTQLSCRRRETARRLVSLNILLSHPRSLKVI